VLKDGYLQQVDTPQHLYDNPTNVFVAAFTGSPSMNLYDAGVTVDGDAGSVAIGSQNVAFGSQTLAKFPDLAQHFTIDAKTVNSGDPDAPEQELGEGIANAVARFSPRSHVHPDAPVEIAVATENLHFFDANTRERVM
jgi:multiple sugar transport system ATP-binding protein